MLFQEGPGREEGAGAKKNLTLIGMMIKSE